MHRFFYPLIAAGACVLALAAPRPNLPRPNFVVILVDVRLSLPQSLSSSVEPLTPPPHPPQDWGWGDLGANGYGAETPHLDALAAKGVRFTDFHANSVCTPSRAALQTGRYNVRYALHGNFDVDSKEGLAAAEVTLGELLSGAGYSTHAIGKVRCVGRVLGAWRGGGGALHSPPHATSPLTPPPRWRCSSTSSL